jgi:hypothetical protein
MSLCVCVCVFFFNQFSGTFFKGSLALRAMPSDDSDSDDEIFDILAGLDYEAPLASYNSFMTKGDARIQCPNSLGPDRKVN